MKEVFAVVGSIILVIVLLVALSFGTGILDLKYYEFFGTRKANVERKIFKENKSYVEGMVNDLAKYKFELSQTEDEIGQKAIKNMIRDRFANFDVNNIENYQLQNFLIEVRGY